MGHNRSLLGSDVTMNATNRTVTLAASLALLLAVGAFAQNFEIPWSTVDAGGTISCTGGSFELSGTIGQPDAGPDAQGAGSGLSRRSHRREAQATGDPERPTHPRADRGVHPPRRATASSASRTGGSVASASAHMVRKPR